jgi:hypothetical protein
MCCQTQLCQNFTAQADILHEDPLEFLRAHLEGNSMNIYQIEKCAGQKL